MSAASDSTDTTLIPVQSLWFKPCICYKVTEFLPWSPKNTWNCDHIHHVKLSLHDCTLLALKVGMGLWTRIREPGMMVWNIWAAACLFSCWRFWSKRMTLIPHEPRKHAAIYLPYSCVVDSGVDSPLLEQLTTVSSAATSIQASFTTMYPHMFIVDVEMSACYC